MSMTSARTAASYDPRSLLEVLEGRQLFFAPPIPPPPPAIPVVNNAFTVTDTDGDIVSVKLSGPGTLAALDTNGIARISRMTLSDTTTASKLKISVTKKPGGDGFVTIAHISDNADLASVDAAKADVSEGLLEFAGLVKEIKLRDISGSTLTMGGDLAKSIKFSARYAFAATLQFGARLITSFNLNGVNQVQVSAGAITTWTSSRIQGVGGTGEFNELTVNLSGVAGVATSLGSMKFFGLLGFSTLNITGNVGDIIGGAIGVTTMAVSGQINTLKSNFGQINGEFTAQNYKTIKSAGGLNGEFSAFSASANNGVSFGSITAEGISASIFVTEKFFEGGRIGSITAPAVTFLNLNAGSIGSFKASGSAQNVSIDLHDSIRKQSLDSFAVGGVFAGDLLVRGNAGSFALGGVDNAVILVGTTAGNSVFDDYRDLGMPDSDTGLFDAGAIGTIKSLTFIKPKASSGFNLGNPDLKAYWVVAKQINTLSSKGSFSLASIGGTRFGIGTQFIKSASASSSFGSFKASNLDAAKLQMFAIDNPSLDIVNTADHTDVSLVDPAVLADARLRLFK